MHMLSTRLLICRTHVCCNITPSHVCCAMCHNGTSMGSNYQIAGQAKEIHVGLSLFSPSRSEACTSTAAVKKWGISLVPSTRRCSRELHSAPPMYSMRKVTQLRWLLALTESRRLRKHKHTSDNQSLRPHRVRPSAWSLSSLQAVGCRLPALRITNPLTPQRPPTLTVCACQQKSHKQWHRHTSSVPSEFRAVEKNGSGANGALCHMPRLHAK